MNERTAVFGDSEATIAPSSLDSTGPATKRSPARRKPRRTIVAKAKTKAETKIVSRPRGAVRAQRTSEILRQILEDHPQDQITIQQIVCGLGATSFGTSLMVFSIPELAPIPIPGLSAVVAIPEMVISAQMIMGSDEIRLPKSLLKRSIPRKAFAAAVKAILPFLEKAEKAVKPRWSGVTTRPAKRFLGAFILLLSALMAMPIPMTNSPPAIAVFVIGLGLVERDGKMIALGILIGLAAIALVGGAFLGLFTLLGALA
jgi:hypothetical protein